MGLVRKALSLAGTYLKTASGHPRPIRYLVGLVTLYTGLGSWCTFRYQGFRLRLYPSALTNALWVDPTGRREDDHLIRSLLREGDTYVDVGANIGTLAIAAAQTVGAAGTVIAIEPHPRTVRYLCGNIKLNQCNNVQIIASAVGDGAGVIRFSSRVSDDQNAIGLASERRDVRVPIDRLDALLEGIQKVRLLKIDVEGYELHVLRGGKETLSKTDIVIFESSEAMYARQGYSCSVVFGELYRCGFEIYQRDATQRWRPVSRSYLSGPTENLAAVRDAGLLGSPGQAVDYLRPPTEFQLSR
jgi:FkbM family methyltransferase